MLEHVDSIENGLRLEGLFVLFSFGNILSPPHFVHVGVVAVVAATAVVGHVHIL